MEKVIHRVKIGIYLSAILTLVGIEIWRRFF